MSKLDFIKNNLKVFFHELRTPLNGIIGFSDLICNEDISSLQAKDLAGDILKSGETLLKRINLLEEILTFTMGDNQIEKIEMSVCDLLEEVEILMQPSIMRNLLQLYKFCSINEEFISIPEAIKSLLYELGISSVQKFEGDNFYIGGEVINGKTLLVIGRGNKRISSEMIMKDGDLYKPAFSIDGISIKKMEGIFVVTGEMGYE